MALTLLLAGLAIILFFVYFFYTGSQRSSYLLYVLLALPFMDLWVTPAYFGPLSVFDALTFMSVFLFYKDFFYSYKKNVLYLYGFLIFITLLFLSSLASEFVVKSLLGIFKVMPPFIYVKLLVKEISEDDLFIEKVIKHLKITGLVAVGFIAMQMIVGLQFTFYEQLNQNVIEGGQIRYPGFFSDSQFSGMFLSMVSFMFLLNLKKPNSPTFKNYIYFGVIVVTMVLAGSRSGLLGFATGLAILIIFVGGNFRRISLIFIVFIAGLLLVFADSFYLFERFTTMDDSLSFRASIWEGAFEIFKKNTMLGIGIGNYRDYVMLHSQDQFIMLDNDEILYLAFPENGYLKFLVEFGLLAFTTLFVMIISPVINVFHYFFSGKKIVRNFFFIAPVCCCLLSFISVFSLGDSRILIVLCSYLAFLIASPTELKPVYES